MRGSIDVRLLLISFAVLFSNHSHFLMCIAGDCSFMCIAGDCWKIGVTSLKTMSKPCNLLSSPSTSHLLVSIACQWSDCMKQCSPYNWQLLRIMTGRFQWFSGSDNMDFHQHEKNNLWIQGIERTFRFARPKGWYTHSQNFVIHISQATSFCCLHMSVPAC